VVSWRASAAELPSCDLKPADVKARPDGTVKVLDFGLAKAIDVSDDGKRLLLLKDSEVQSGAKATGQIVVIQNWTEQLKRLVPAK
jgi:serine/threonine protein kinase